MISAALEAEILRLYHAEHWPLGTIASQVGVHYKTVRRVLAQAGQIPATSSKPSRVDPFRPFIAETLQKYPRLRASRLYAMVCERGYVGSESHFRALVARLRPRLPAEAYLRLRTLPGEQAQVDWAHFGKLRMGQAERRLLAFVMVLSWSRQIFLRFYLGDAMPNFLRGHVDAFSAWQSVPRVILYDNLKSAVLERRQDAIHFHPTLLELAAHYRFEPRPVAIARGNEKGRVERAIQYIRHAFFAARKWQDIEDLNAQAQQWCWTEAAGRPCPEERQLTVGEAFHQEQPHLLALPDSPFPTSERSEVRVGKTPYVRFDGNDYSVPHTHVRRTLVVLAELDRLRILDGSEVLATHRRSFDRGQTIEDPAHVQALVAAKHEAQQARGMDRLHQAVPVSRDFLVVVAERGGNLGGATSSLLRLLDSYGATALHQALNEALQADRVHMAAVHQILDRQRHLQGLPPPLPVTLPADPRVRNLVVRPHDLTRYDALSQREGAHHETT